MAGGWHRGLLERVSEALADLREEGARACNRQDALSDIRQMTSEAIHQQRPEAFELLSFSLHDTLRHVKELEDGSIAAADAGKAGPDGRRGPDQVDACKTVQPATVAPRLGSGGQRPDTTVKPEIDWRDLYRGMEGPLCEAVHMTQIADDLVDHVDHNDLDFREQLAFAVNYSRQLLEDQRRRYYEHERTED